ncbi:TonB-dependent receptor [Thauera sinica]|uniref:TonB-dependent receptor n=1 Tax=Thauera sinica TaxID=2665146 RepID=A0ABW1AP52_9RHOO|nr:TonB-dependent receptor [Thauera sp. K11]ATE62311.1 TonB-dependent receptor [Thauera sp. K11]
MSIRLSAAAVAACAALPSALAIAAGEHQFEPVIVSATRIDVTDVDATYASEVHTRKDIERSGATTLVDYLSRQTSVQVVPSFGNRFTPSLNMRGYGLTSGFQNVMITVDGRRLNNIDSVPQLLGGIALADVDRIEITKGSGSVLYGDGATAGSIQIYTRPHDGARIEAYGGSHGALGGTVAAGLVRERFSLSATADHGETDGYSDKDPSGHRDASKADTWHVAAGGNPVDGLKLTADAGRTRIDTRYPGPLDLARFEDDPAQNDGSLYTHQRFDSAYWSVGAEYRLTDAWRLSARHQTEDKTSEFLGAFSSTLDYTYDSDELALQYLGDRLSVTAGVQSFDGERKGASEKTSKRNLGWFVQGQYAFDRLTLSAGARRERVEYGHRPDAGARLKDDERFNSWDVGFNYRIDPALTVFGNYNDAFQAPDIDRFFVCNAFDADFTCVGTAFNAFIEPMHARTVTLGLNHVLPANRLKLAVFHARLKDEIYFDPVSFANTNFDRSHKYGIELQDTWQISPALTGSLNYAWTRAIIDRDGSGAFDGKELPAAPKHNLVLGFAVKVSEAGTLNLSHTWRSKAWADGDFANGAPRQREYQSTDLAYRHRVTKDVELYGAVSNLFAHENGVWVESAFRPPVVVYPVDFVRTWKLGARVSF